MTQPLIYLSQRAAVQAGKLAPVASKFQLVCHVPSWIWSEVDFKHSATTKDRYSTCYQIWAKSGNLWPSYWCYWWFDNFPCPFFGGWFSTALFSRVQWTELHQIWEHHRLIIDAPNAHFRFQIRCAILKPECLRVDWSKIQAEFHTFVNKIRGWMGLLVSLMSLT